MKTKNVKGLIFNTAFIFAPALICIAIFKSENEIENFILRLNISSISFLFPYFIFILLMCIAAILFRFSFKYTTNNLLRFIVIILSASISFPSIIKFGPGGPCNGPYTILFFFCPLLLVYLFYILIIALSFFKILENKEIVEIKPDPAKREEPARTIIIEISNVKSFIACAAYLFVPSLTVIILLKSDQITDHIIEFPLLVIAITVILFMFLIKDTKNNLTRLIVTIPSALILISSIIIFGPKDACNGPAIITFLLLPLLCVYVFCLLAIFLFYSLKKSKYANIEKSERTIKVEIKNKKSFIACTAYLFVPSLTVIMLLNSCQITNHIPWFPLLVIAIPVILFILLVKYTKNNLTRLIVTIPSAIILISSIIIFTPNNVYVIPAICVTYLLTLFVIYLYCILVVFIK